MTPSQGEHAGPLRPLPRRDGIVLQTGAAGDFGSADETPDRAAAEQTVRAVADLNQRIRAKLRCA